MRCNRWTSAIVGVACAALVTVTLSTGVNAAETARKAQKSYGMMHTPVKGEATRSAPKQETVTLEIRGANSAEDARMLSSTLTAHQVKAPLEASQGKPCRVTATIDPQTDLGALGQAILSTRTPDKAKESPALDLVVFGNFDRDSAKKAAEALAKIKGIDAKVSTANIPAGEYNIRVSGGAKVTANQIHHALQNAGVWTQFTRNSSARRS